MTEPLGASIAVWRRRGGDREWLLLHRAAAGPEYEGDWAWTPPAGARAADESIDRCARRELREETGLELDCSATPCGTHDWAVYVAEAPPDAVVRLDDEHDCFRWLPLEEAASKCLPASVGETMRNVAGHLDQEKTPEVPRTPGV